METIKNSQEQNESLDRLHPEWPAQYGGSVINTKTADPEFVKRVLDNARKNM